MSPIVVKLGGSLYNTPELSNWLQALAIYSARQPIIIVPGGGPFADLVRDAQKQHALSDTTAHHMAIVAMKQFGILIMGLEPRCQLLTSDRNLAPLSIWLPDDSILKQSTIEQSWNISSDSLALWLSGEVSAQQLLLVKCIEPPSTSIKQLAEQNIIDNGFSDLFAKTAVTIKIIHSHNYHRLHETVLDDSGCLSLP